MASKKIAVRRNGQFATIVFPSGEEFHLGKMFISKRGIKRTQKHIGNLRKIVRELYLETEPDDAQIIAYNNQIERILPVLRYANYVELEQKDIMLPLNGCKISLSRKTTTGKKVKEEQEFLHCVLNDDSVGGPHLNKLYQVLSIRGSAGASLLGMKVGDSFPYTMDGIEWEGVITEIYLPSNSAWIFKKADEKPKKEEALKKEMASVAA